jgi:pimeloyl-ACP methyl ester carboxylesterase
VSAANIPRVDVGDVELAYEAFGDRAGVPVLLVMGLATQMLGWPDEFCAGLAERGNFVVRFDNRDVGLSTHLADAPPGDLMAAVQGDSSSASYSLSDMARDTVGLLEALELESAHLVGASMGGMIAQTVAIEYPERVRSLTSIMSTTGNAEVGAPSEAALQVLLAPAAETREAVIEQTVQAYRVIASPGFELDEAALRERAGLSFDRAHDPAGVSRQLVAIIASGDRTGGLAGLAVPTLVVHGADDALVNVSGGRATAAAIPDAELVVIDGMGHDLPRGLWSRVIERIAAHVERTERAAV